MAGDDPLGSPDGRHDFTGALNRWVAEAQVDRAAEGRSRARWLARQSAEESSFATVLVDLAERGGTVVIQTTLGHKHRGRLVALGTDFVALATGKGAEVLVGLAAIVALRADGDVPPALSGREVRFDVPLIEALSVLGEDRPRVRVLSGSGAAVTGTLMAVGQDVLTLRMDGDHRHTVYLPLHALVELRVALG